MVSDRLVVVVTVHVQATEQRLSRWLCHLRGIGVAVGPLFPSYCEVIRHQLIIPATPCTTALDGADNGGAAAGAADGWSGAAMAVGCILSAVVGAVVANLGGALQKRQERSGAGSGSDPGGAPSSASDDH